MHGDKKAACGRIKLLVIGQATTATLDRLNRRFVGHDTLNVVETVLNGFRVIRGPRMQACYRKELGPGREQILHDVVHRVAGRKVRMATPIVSRNQIHNWTSVFLGRSSREEENRSSLDKLIRRSNRSFTAPTVYGCSYFVAGGAGATHTIAARKLDEQETNDSTGKERGTK